MSERFAPLRAAALARIAGAEPAHDALHVERVMASARRIAAAEGADVDVCVTAALLHELFNYPKSHPESSRSGDVCAEHATTMLREHGFDAAFTERVAYCIRVHSFSRGIMLGTRSKPRCCRMPIGSMPLAPSGSRAASPPRRT